MRARFSILLVGDSGDGKTTQLGELALWLFKTTGGTYDAKTKQAVGGLRTRLYSCDLGGWHSIKHLVNLGIIEVVDISLMDQPFHALNKAALGLTPLPLTGKWHDDRAGIGLFAYDSATGISHHLMLDLAKAGAKGTNVGGAPGMKFTQGDLTIASNNQSHYGLAQSAVIRAMVDSQLTTDQIVCWTARIRRGEDEGLAPIIGPALAGKAMTADVPAFFTYTFRLGTEVLAPGQKPLHTLYYDDHKDPSAPTAKVLGNARLPLGKASDAMPQKIQPASVVKILELIGGAHSAAEQDAIATLLS